MTKSAVERSKGMPSHAARIDGRWVEVETPISDQCERDGCEAPLAYIVERAWWKHGMSHPSSAAWVGLRLCWGHARHVELMNERYSLGVFTRRIR